MFASNEVTKSNLYQPEREVKIYFNKHKIAAISSGVGTRGPPNDPTGPGPPMIQQGGGLGSML